MHRKWWLLAALLAVAYPLAGQSQGGNYWLITRATGNWEYRVGTGPPRRLTGSYDYLVPAGQVRCLEPDLRKCDLQYLSSQTTNATKKLAVPLQPGGVWISLKGLTPAQSPVLAATSQDLSAKMLRLSRPGGSRAVSGCEGDLQLEAPACGENIDIGDFRIRWAPSPSGTVKRLALLVEKADDRTRRFRATLEEPSGEFAGERLNDFLREQQAPASPTDVVVTVTDGSRRALRLVHIPPRSQTDDYKSLVDQIASPDPVVRAVSIMSLALDRGMWSRAALEARRLIELGGSSPALMEYALAGVCQSDFEADKTRLRKVLPGSVYDRVCGAALAKDAPDRATAVEEGADSVAPGSPPKSRPGMALLIGNWDYSSAPLYCVKKDLEGMSDALKRLGFDVVVVENLRGSQEFGRALAEALKQRSISPDDALFVYYSGHGVQLNGKDYLLGTGAPPAARGAEELRPHSQSAEDLLFEMEGAAAGTRILVIEACRDSVFSPAGSSAGPAPKGGFAFRSDDVPNTVVMFANGPGLPTPARSDSGLMGPFTESLTLALNTSSGDILEVYDIAARKTREFSPGLEPVLYRSKEIERLILRPKEQVAPDTRAKELLRDAGASYERREWSQFQASVERGRLIASAPELKQRLDREVEFVKLVRAASAAQRPERRNWSESAESWERAAGLFPARQWVTMSAMLAALYADDIERAVRALATLSAQADNEPALQARKMLAELLKAFPEFEPIAARRASATTKISGEEFEIVK
jgi:hypothetical protein